MEIQLNAIENVSVERAGTWFVPVSLRKRLTKFSLWFGIGSFLAAWLFYLQLQNDVDTPYMLWGFAIFSVGTFLGVRAFGIRDRRVFDTTEVQYGHSQRLKRALRWLVPGFAILAVIWGLQLSSNQFSTYWWYAWPTFMPLFVGLWLYLLRSERVLTDSGLYAHAQLENARKVAELGLHQKVETAFNSGLARYVMAAAFLYSSYYFAFEDASRNKSGGLSVVCVVVAIILARELGLWLLGIGAFCIVGWVLFAGFAALPVSVAVIVGALIIASAVRNK